VKRFAILFVLSASASALAAEKWPEPTGTIEFRETISHIGRTLLDSSGDIWFVENVAGHHPYGEGGGVYLLSEKGWTPTPVKQLPRPAWGARIGPPWLSWAGPAALVTGEKGAALAVVIRDIYQDMVKELPKEATHWEVRKLEEARYADVKEKYWLEAWLRKDGKWVGPMKLDRLISTQWDYIREHFRSVRSSNTWFDLCSDGNFIWTAFNGTVSVHDGDNVHTKALSQPEGWARYPLSGIRFFRNAKDLWIVAKGEEGFAMFELKFKERNITAKELPKLSFARYVYRPWAMPRIHTAKDKRLIAWVPEYEPIASHPSFLEKNGWKMRDDLDAFQFEDGDGGLWFRRELRWKEDSGFTVLTGEKAELFAVPNVWPVAITVAGSKRYVLYTDQYKKENHRIAELSSTGKPGVAGWKVDAVYAITSHPHMPTQLTADRWGNLVSEYGAVGHPAKNRP
jgi:hypothetical protein